MKPNKHYLLLLVALATLTGIAHAERREIPIIDIHSQFDQHVSPERVLQTAKSSGVEMIFLSTRGRAEIQELIDMHLLAPECIVPAVRSKGGIFFSNSPRYYQRLELQGNNPLFGAKAEIILEHGKKGDRAHEYRVSINEPQAMAAVRLGITKGWPVILHYEFAWLEQKYGTAEKQKILAELSALLERYPDHPFGLMHMGQLNIQEVEWFLIQHPNVFFITSRTTPNVIRNSPHPWTPMFRGSRLARDWERLIIQYPDRFVLAFDAVFEHNWGRGYERRVHFWRRALDRLPEDVARAIAHQNAERLWGLPPTQVNGGCSQLP